MGSEGASVSIRFLTQAVATSYDDGVSHKDLPFFVLHYVAGLPLSILSAWAQDGDADSWIPYCVVPGAIFAAVTWAGRGTPVFPGGLVWNKGAFPEFSRAFLPFPLAGKSPSERTLPHLVVNCRCWRCSEPFNHGRAVGWQHYRLGCKFVREITGA